MTNKLHHSFLIPAKTALLCFILFGLVACSTDTAKKVVLAPPTYLLPNEYQRTVIQGRKIDVARLDMIQVGSSRVDVLLLLGDPVIQDIFNPTRWIYLYKEKKHGSELVEYRVEVDFEGDQVAAIRREGI